MTRMWRTERPEDVRPCLAKDAAEGSFSDDT
jgi:hypothetical protein